MASATQRRSRGFIIKTPSVSSNDGTLADAPLADKPVDEDVFTQHHDDDQSDSLQQDASAHDEIAPLSANVLEALRIVSRLEQLGLDKQQIPLPKCIVLGQQSTGKSSVIEAISGIKTPRDTGTCTRCPLFIELQPSTDPKAAWHAEISLLRYYDLATNRNHRGMDTEFQGWVPAAVPAKMLFAQTDNPAHLESLIRCAQCAILSPLENPQSFLDPSFDITAIQKTLFSPNIVCIVVSKPSLPPLSFFDLPGMIGQAENDEEAFTVPMVKNLLTKYIMDPEALVLVTCTLENDVANSMAAGLAQDLKVTDRCMGVLTKPDRLPPGESPRDLAKILDGRSFKLGHGYFVVKNLSSDEINQGLTHQDARRLEQQFFNTAAPWSKDLRSFQARFGTVNMQQYLSVELGNRVMLKLPAIRRQIEERLTSVEEELSRIPDIPLHTAARTVADVVQAFANNVRNEMVGEHSFLTWSNIWDEVQQDMWDMLLKLKPTMSTTGQLDEGLFSATLPGRSVHESIVIDSEDDIAMSNTPETPSKKRKHDAQPKREAQTPALGLSPLRTPRKAASRNACQQSPRTLSSNQSDDIAALKKLYNLDDVTRYISLNSKSKIPGQINPKVREELMLSALEYWPLVIKKFFADLEHQLKQRIQFLFDKHFSEWKGSELYAASFAIVKGLLDNNIHEQQTTMASESLKDEREGPHIFHRDIFRTEKAATMARYSQARINARLSSFVRDAVQYSGRDMSPADKEKIRKDDKKMALIREEPYTHEIDLVADITTYYMIAARRFHDSVTMRIESKFFKQLRDKLRDQLQDELGIYDVHQGPYNAQRLLAESPERLTRRNILVAKKKALSEGLQCFSNHLQQLQAGNGTGLAHNRPSNYQPPSVSSPRIQDTEAVHSHGLPLRSMSRPLPNV